MTTLEKIRNGTHRVSQSRLKKLIGDKPNKYLHDEKTTPEMMLGTAVEEILLEGKERFIESTQSFPDSVMDCVDYLISYKKPLTPENIFAWAEFADYGKGWKPTTRVSKIMNQGAEEYYTIASSGKPLLSPDEASLARKMAMSLAQVPIISQALLGKYQVQKRIEFDYDGVPCKGFIDLFLPDEEQIIDIKVTGMPPKMAARKFRWDIQGSFYAEPLERPKPPIFVVAKTYDPDNPVVYKMSEEDMYIGKWGGEIEAKWFSPKRNTLRKIEGFHSLIKKYKWHSTHDKWEKTQEQYERGFEYLNVYS